MTKLTDRELLALVREHLDVERLLTAHPEVTRADLEAFWARRGLGKGRRPPVAQTHELFDAPQQQRDAPSRPLRLVARCDGAARGNPGPAAIGAVLQDADGDTLIEVSEAIGRATNNVAEYHAVIRAVERALELGCTDLTLLLDSDLLVNQLCGTYKVRAPHLRPLRQQAVALLDRLHHWQVRYVPRAENHEADRLANLALDGRQP